MATSSRFGMHELCPLLRAKHGLAGQASPSFTNCQFMSHTFLC